MKTTANKNKTPTALFHLSLLIFTSLALSAQAGEGDTVTWQANADGASFYWDDAANWKDQNSVNRLPEAGDIVKIPNRTSAVYGYHTISVTNPLPKFKSVYLGSRRTLNLKGWDTKLEADGEIVLWGETKANYTEQAASRIVCDGEFTDSSMSNRVWISAGSLVLSNSYAKISAGGYGKRSGPAWREKAGPDNACAPHGGKSSTGNGSLYGSITEPVEPGSGSCHDSGKRGGGAIRIEVADRIVVNGPITANGDASAYGWGGGAGSGGSIYISCGTISGTSSVSANGGGNTSSKSNGAGGGGRVAVHYNTELQKDVPCGVSFSARGGADLDAGPRYLVLGESGTLYFSDDQFLNRPGRMLAGWVYYGPQVAVADKVVGENVSLTNSLVEIPAGGTINVTGDLSIYGTATRLNGLSVHGRNIPINVGGNLSLTGARLKVTDGSEITVGGDVLLNDGSTVNNSGEIYLKAAPTNGVDQAWGARLKVGGVMSIGANSGYFPVCNPTNGSIVVVNAAVLTMKSTSLISADVAGWGKQRGPGTAYNGAGHGGKGGSSKGGKTYGDMKRPITPGSGSNHSNYGQTGGGYIGISTTGKMNLGGTISANGASSFAWHYGAGASAGGGVYLSCGNVLSGTATITANGGSANGGGYGGGGGRIAIWHHGLADDVNITTAVKGGKYNSETEHSSNWGEDGTVYWHQVCGTMLILR